MKKSLRSKGVREIYLRKKEFEAGTQETEG